MNKNKSNSYKGIVVALKANFLIVEIDYVASKESVIEPNPEKVRLLCTRRSKLDYQSLFIDVGDIVFVESIDFMLHAKMSAARQRERNLVPLHKSEQKLSSTHKR